MKGLIKIYYSFNLVLGLSLINKIVTTLTDGHSNKEFIIKLGAGTLILYFVLDFIKRFMDVDKND